MSLRPHPGPRHPIRCFHSIPANPHHLRAELGAGQTLHEAVFSVLTMHALPSASLTLFGGAFSSIQFTTGDIETRPDSDKQANFTFIRDWGNCDFIYGAATAGVDIEDAPLLHCHAVFSAEKNTQVGGHLFPGECHISQPIIAHIIGHPTIKIQQSLDCETTHMIFNPLTEGSSDAFQC